MQTSMVPLNPPQGDGRGAGAVVVSMPVIPKDYVVWSIGTLVYGNPCCLGLIALIFSIKSRDRKMEGDMTGAQTYGTKARCFNAVALALVVISIVITIIASIAISASSATSASAAYSYGRY